MGQQRINNTEMVRRINISRRTWYRLLSADIEEAKLSTLIKIANALNVSVSQLTDIYFSNRSLNVKSGNLPTTSNLPSNCLVKANLPFVKTWKVSNATDEDWQELTLHCIDKSLRIQLIDNESENTMTASILTPKQTIVQVPNTKIGTTVTLSVSFLAPSQLGMTVSHWRFYKDGEQLQDKSVPKLDCLVNVVAS